MTQELDKSVETALKAFEELKGMVTGFDKKLTDMSPKMDAFDAATFDKLQKDIAKGIEAAQKSDAAVKQLEDDKKARELQLKTLEEKQSLLETALNRPLAINMNEGKEQEADRLAKGTALFNEFARKGGATQRDYADFLNNGDEAKSLALKTMSVNSDADGGYLVMPTLGGTITTLTRETSPMRQLASVETISTDSLEYMLDNDEADAGWVGETQARPETNTPKIGKLLIPVNEIYAMPKATQKLIDDAAVDIEAWLARKVSEKFSRMENTAFMVGDGMLKPRGLLTQPAGTTIGSGQVEQIVSGSASAFTYDGLVNLQSALKEEYQRNASWIVNRLGFGSLLLLKDLNGTPIFNMAYDQRVGLQRGILGAPLYFASDMPVVGSNALAAVYGDIKRAYQIVDRTGIRVLRDPFTDKPFVKFYTTKRVGGAPVNFEAYKILKISS